ncbi:hypothetical protein PSAC2689_110227 [Paraburkholderia sacchari]|uniref:hypothetical protein n=1 Tax=Paraburkholderia sacchari TaxID=159450 RepID=UPI0039A67180
MDVRSVGSSYSQEFTQDDNPNTDNWNTGGSGTSGSETSGPGTSGPDSNGLETSGSGNSGPDSNGSETSGSGNSGSNIGSSKTGGPGNSNVGGSGQAAPPLGTQGGKADALPPTGLAAGDCCAQGSNAKAQDHAAPPLGTQGGNPPPVSPQSPNTGQAVTPGASGSHDPAPGSQRSGVAGDAGMQGENGQGGAPGATGAKPLQADASNPSRGTGHHEQAVGTQNGNMGGFQHAEAHGGHAHKAIVSGPHPAVAPGGGPSGVAPNQPGGQLSPSEPPAINKPVLPGVTEDELKGLLNKYDMPIDGGNQDSRNGLNDANAAEKINAATKLDYTGYPQDVRNFEDQLSSSRGQLAALQPEMRDYYTSQLAALDTVYRNVNSPDARSDLNEKATQIENEIRNEYNHSVNNLLDRTMAIFNHPVGEGYLGKEFSEQIKHLDQLREQFLNAPDAEHRDSLFAQATKLKTQLQAAAALGLDNYLAKDKTAWDEANKYVDKLIADAQANPDPAKRYKSISDGLFSLNSGMGEDEVADRRVLKFTERLMDDPDLRQKLDAWQVEAGTPLNAQGVGAARSYTDIINDLPAAGPDYVRDLADRYTNVIRSQTDGERTAAFNRAKPYVQAAEGFARFMLGLTPLAPLTAVLDGSSTLSPMARLGIDVGSGLAGAAVGSLAGDLSSVAKGVGRFISELKTEAAVANESMQDLKLGLLGKLVPVGEQEGDVAQNAYKPAGMGPTPDPRMLEARGRIEQNPMDVPSRYGVKVDGSTLKPDKHDPGVLNDENGQHYVRSGDQYFKAKFDSYNKTWRVVHPDSPDAFSYPIRYDPKSGAWSVHGNVRRPGAGGLSKLKPLDVEAHFEAKPKGQLTRDADRAGLFVDKQGQPFIQQGGKPYPVRYDPDWGTWRLTSMDRPDKRGPAVHFDGNKWSIRTDLGLRGGNPIPESYAFTPQGMSTDSLMDGMRIDEHGQEYVRIGNKDYAVSYDTQRRSWGVFNPADATSQRVPVRLNPETLEWEPGEDWHPEPMDLGAHGEEPLEQVVNRWTNDRNRMTGAPEASIPANFDPKKLGLHGYRHVVVDVDDTTFQNLKTAQDVMNKVKEVLPHGSGNQTWDIDRTEGESYARVKLLRQQPWFSDPNAISEAGAGNCGECANLAFREAGARVPDHPVLQVTGADGLDHTWVLIGDPRDPRYGAGAVVVDPWPTLPTAHLVGNDHFGYPDVVPVQSSRHEPFDITQLPPAKPSREIAEVTGAPLHGDDVLAEIRSANGQSRFVWTHLVSTDPSTTYRSPTAQYTFDHLPNDIIARYLPPK